MNTDNDEIEMVAQVAAVLVVAIIILAPIVIYESLTIGARMINALKPKA